jgi:hypothetical protein
MFFYTSSYFFLLYFQSLNIFPASTHFSTPKQQFYLDANAIFSGGCFIPFLIFLWLLSFYQGKESEKMLIET